MTVLHHAPIDAFIFDMDGTMIASMPWHRQSWVKFARRAGMRAVAICSSHTAAKLTGPHVIASAADYHELGAMNFLDTYHVASK